eukprot:GHVT01073143.1.p1 GENE.GHVT01073143.1~~GHVT01073143.1.p1  ORF type:complete len:492 (-),score=79.10 GHVT01073143.1:1860-3335(-)
MSQSSVPSTCVSASSQPALWKRPFFPSRLGFGTYRISRHDEEHSRALRLAIQLGLRVIDTATNYADGDAERVVGHVLQELYKNTPLAAMPSEAPAATPAAAIAGTEISPAPETVAAATTTVAAAATLTATTCVAPTTTTPAAPIGAAAPTSTASAAAAASTIAATSSAAAAGASASLAPNGTSAQSATLESVCGRTLAAASPIPLSTSAVGVSPVLSRGDVFLLSKVGFLGAFEMELLLSDGEAYLDMVESSHFSAHCIHPTFIKIQLRRSLKRLQTTYLDAFLLHNPEQFFLKTLPDNLVPILLNHDAHFAKDPSHPDGSKHLNAQAHCCKPSTSSNGDSNSSINFASTNRCGNSSRDDSINSSCNTSTRSDPCEACEHCQVPFSHLVHCTERVRVARVEMRRRLLLAFEALEEEVQVNKTINFYGIASNTLTFPQVHPHFLPYEDLCDIAQLAADSVARKQRPDTDIVRTPSESAVANDAGTAAAHLQQ